MNGAEIQNKFQAGPFPVEWSKLQLIVKEDSAQFSLASTTA
jgi:hypothetical protein